ncbi:MAG TPA: pantoate--beta-alanine ligase [Bacillaceae bacterium]
MEIITKKRDLQQKVLSIKSGGKKVGFVPTMGFLHEGHLELVRKAKSENDAVVMSIFVNPLQFGPNEDFEAYPRNEKRDTQLAETEGVDVLFIPSPAEMYGSGMSIRMGVASRTDVLCGKSRPGHFDGVVTVLSKLFHIVMPDRAYFGLKDAQQVAVVDLLIRDLDFPVELVPVDTIREEDGLAKSSRNVYLSEQERAQAPMIFRSLEEAKRAILDGERDASAIALKLERKLKETGGVIDYVEITSYPELKPLARLEGKLLIAVAVKFSKARLIDNMIVDIRD